MVTTKKIATARFEHSLINSLTAGQNWETIVSIGTHHEGPAVMAAVDALFYNKQFEPLNRVFSERIDLVKLRADDNKESEIVVRHVIDRLHELQETPSVIADTLSKLRILERNVPSN